jgi:hypothetical protein
VWWCRGERLALGSGFLKRVVHVGGRLVLGSELHVGENFSFKFIYLICF